MSFETNRRLHKFFDLHMRHNIHSHPFASKAVGWATCHAHITSAKLLNASGWDDVQEHGRLTPWTVRQRTISARLLEDFLVHEERSSQHMTVAAIESLLSFELLTDQFDNFAHLWDLFQRILRCPEQSNHDDWVFHSRCSVLLDQANRLRQLGFTKADAGPPPSNLTLTNMFDPNRALAEVLLVFTLGDPYVIEHPEPIHSALLKLYNTITAAADLHSSTVSPQDIYTYLSAQHSEPPPVQPDSDDPRLSPLHLATSMVASSLLHHGTHGSQDQQATLASAASRLRHSLGGSSSGGTMAESHVTWTPFAGALLWCHAVGVRFAATTRDRTWFLMHFLRTAQSYILDDCERTSRAIAVVLAGLGGVVSEVTVPAGATLVTAAG